MTDPTNDPRSGEQRQRDERIVNEILAETGHALNNHPVEPNEAQKATRRLELANQEVLARIKKYYDLNPLTSNISEVRKIIWDVYSDCFSKWSKDDVLFMLTLQQSHLCMKGLGYI